MKSFDVCIQGTGPVGMCLALALSRQGLAVAWAAPPVAGTPANERSDARTDPRADVRTYALSAGSVALLQQLKIWPALPQDARTAVNNMRIHGDAPGAALHFSAAQQQQSELAWIVDAAELESALDAALRFAPHVERVDAEVPAPLQAFAQGRDAACRQRLGVHMPIHRYGQHAVAARVRAERAHDGVARQWFRSPDVLALLPFDRPAAGHSYGLVWSLPQARADEVLALDEPAFNQALTEATGGAVGALTLVSERAAWPLVYGRAEQVCGDGWVLLGDAAHVVHPLAGQGLNLGLADVQALAETLAARETWRALGDAKLLRRYARTRKMPVRAMGQVTDGLLELFSHPSPVVRELRNRGLTLLDKLPPLKRVLTNQALRS
jgi:2-polyprenyl-6-methoxyphenol hydroxylase-like FAD-dependent oxidoreductase